MQNTSRAVDLDLINNIMREPYRERFSIILNELGVGLAGRGEDLDAVIRRANPALKEVDSVLKILARQNDQLEQLAVDSDTIMAPLARERGRVASSIENMSAVAEATAERRGALEEDIAKLPEFLAELQPTMVQLGETADEMTPVLTDLGEAAPDINTFVEDLGPFSAAATPALESLGEAGETGGPALQAALPVIRDTKQLAAQLKPVAKQLGDVLVDFQREDGIQRFLDYIFFQGTAVNGFDSFGHYLRAGLIVNQCTTYATAPTGGCSANFRAATASSTRAPAAAAAPLDPTLEWMQRFFDGEDVEPVRSRPDEDEEPPADRDGGGQRDGGGEDERRQGRHRRRRRRARAGARGDPDARARPGGDAHARAGRHPGARRHARRRPTRATIPASRSWTTSSEAASSELPRQHRRQPGADRRGHGPRDPRRRLPLLQRQPGPAVRALVQAHGGDAERGEPRARQRGADRRDARRHRRLDRRRAPRRRREHRAPRAEDGAVGRPAADRLHAADPPALRARPQVRGDHARHVRRRLRRR